MQVAYYNIIIIIIIKYYWYFSAVFHNHWDMSGTRNIFETSKFTKFVSNTIKFIDIIQLKNRIEDIAYSMIDMITW